MSNKDFIHKTNVCASIIVKKGSIFHPLLPRGSERPRSRGADLSGPDGEKLEMVTQLPFKSC